MKSKILLLAQVIALTLLLLSQNSMAQYNNLSNTVVDGGGKTYTNKITGSNLNNVTFQNFVFTGNGGFEFVSGTLNGIKVINNKANNIVRFISVGSVWGDPGNMAYSTNVEISCNEIDGASGYVFYLHNTHNFNVHHNSVVNTEKGGDGNHPGVYFCNNSDGQFHHNWLDNCYGNGFRVWGDAPSGTASVKIYNCVVVNSKKYSGVEANGNYGGPFKLEIYNNVFGNLDPLDYVSAGLTIYDLLGSSVSFTNNKVFNTSAGMISEEGGSPTSTAGSAYYATMALAGFTSTSAVKLPDGTNWNDGGCSSGPPPAVVPVASAGADKAITLPTNTTSLDGSASYNPGGGTLTYEWTQISGPSTAGIATPTAAGTNITGLVQGVYVFQILVTNADGKTATDTVQVTVNAALPPAIIPVANAGADKTITLPTNTTTVDGSASYNPGGGTLTYAWTKIAGPTSYSIAAGTAASTALNSLTQGVYKFRLVVRNSQGNTAADTVQVTVNAAPPPPVVIPVANAGADRNITLPTNSTSVDGTTSYNPGGGALLYAWTKIAGPTTFTITNPTSAATNLTGLVQGTYLFRLLVTNGTGNTDADTVQVTVNPAAPVVIPVSNAGADITITLPTNTTALDGSASSNPGGGALTYTWTKVSGPSSFYISTPGAAKTNITGLVQGTYQFRLVVTNSAGNTDDDFVNVIVNPAPELLKPVADAGKDTSVTFPGGAVKLNGKNSYARGGASIKDYKWQQVSGPTSVSFASITSAETNGSNLEPGDYIFELSVTDNKGQSSTDQVKVTVVNNLRFEKVVSLYPNPTTDRINIKLITDSTGKMSVRIFNLLGRVVNTTDFEKTQMVFEKGFSIKQLPAGIYVVEIKVNDKLLVLKKFLKQ